MSAVSAAARTASLTAPVHRPPGGVAGDTAEEEWYPEISLAPALGMARAPDAGAELSSRHRDGTSMSLAEPS